MGEKTIREIRQDIGLTQQDMASKLGISRQQYANYEMHPENVTIRQARQICAILGAEYERVFFGAFSVS